jgi:hypothetical protein
VFRPIAQQFQIPAMDDSERSAPIPTKRSRGLSGDPGRRSRSAAGKQGFALFAGISDRVDGIIPMQSRSFDLADAMILVVAAGAALCVNRADWQGVPFGEWRPDAYDSIKYLVSLFLPHAVAMTAALLAIRMRRPRPALRRLARQPGVVACEVALVVVLVVACWAACAMAAGRVIDFWLFIERPPGSNRTGRGFGVWGVFTGRLLTGYGDRMGFGVAGAWLSLLLFGRWRPERTWIDRLCRAMGWLWLSVTLMIWLGSLLFWI